VVSASPVSRFLTANRYYPKLLCGLASLYSIRHAAIFRRASNKFWNQLTIKHSCAGTEAKQAIILYSF